MTYVIKDLNDENTSWSVLQKIIEKDKSYRI